MKAKMTAEMKAEAETVTMETEAMAETEVTAEMKTVAEIGRRWQ